MNTNELELKVRAAIAGCKRPGNESISLQDGKGYWRPATELLNEVLKLVEAANAYKNTIESVADRTNNPELKGALYNAGVEFDNALDGHNVHLNNAKRLLKR